MARALADKGTLCDLLLVDGGHSKDATRLDAYVMRRAVPTSARVVIVDVIVDSIVALRRLEKQQAVRILEAYSYKMTKQSSCVRWSNGRILPCNDRWGFIVGEYVGDLPAVARTTHALGREFGTWRRSA